MVKCAGKPQQIRFTNESCFGLAIILHKAFELRHGPSQGIWFLFPSLFNLFFPQFALECDH